MIAEASIAAYMADAARLGHPVTRDKAIEYITAHWHGEYPPNQEARAARRKDFEQHVPLRNQTTYAKAVEKQPSRQNDGTPSPAASWDAWATPAVSPVAPEPTFSSGGGGDFGGGGASSSWDDSSSSSSSSSDSGSCSSSD